MDAHTATLLRIVAIAALFVWLTLDGLVVFRRKTSSTENRDHFSLWVITFGNLAAWVIAISLAFARPDTLRSTAPWQIAGLVLLVAGAAFRFVAIAQLGRFHTPNVAILDDHQLMDRGLYHCIRHPSYLGALVAFLGFGLALGNWLGVVILMLVSIAVYLFRIHEEEAALRAGLGQPYVDYCRRTRRLIPGIY